MVSQVDYDAHLANYATLSGRVATAESSLATLNATYNSYLDKWDSIGIRGANTPAIKTLWSLAEDNRDEIAAHLLRIQTLEQSGSTLEADLQAWVQANYGENNTWVTQNKTYLTALPQTLN